MFSVVLANNIVTNYALGIILVTNIAVWTHYTVTDFYYTENYTGVLNFTTCDNTTMISKLFWTSRVIVDPMVLEYALLATLFLFEMRFRKYEFKEISKNLETCEPNELLLLTNFGQKVNQEEECFLEDDPLLSTRKHMISPKTSIFRALKRNACVIAGLLITTVGILTNIFNIFLQPGKYTTFLNISFVFRNAFMFAITVYAFILINRDFKLKQTALTPNVSGNLLILSLFGLTFFMTLSVLANIYRTDDVAEIIKISGICLEVTCILTFSLQTGFIIQINNGRSYRRTQGWFCLTIDKICLTLALMQIAIWTNASFVIHSFRWAHGFETQYYGEANYDILFHVFWPFVLFFHFKSFVSFYGIYMEQSLTN